MCYGGVFGVGVGPGGLSSDRSLIIRGCLMVECRSFYGWEEIGSIFEVFMNFLICSSYSLSSSTLHAMI